MGLVSTANRIRLQIAGQTVGSYENGSLTTSASDHIGSGSLTRTSGGSQTLQRYQPYGQIRGTGNNSLATDWTFTGQTDDPGSGLQHYGARYYDPVLSRFIQADMIVPNPANSQDVNRYAYVRNNPLRYTDPDGREPEEAQCGSAARTCDVSAGYTPGALKARNSSPAARGESLPSLPSGAPIYLWGGADPASLSKWSEAFGVDPRLLELIATHEGGVINNFGPFGRRAQEAARVLVGADTNGITQVKESNIVALASKYWGVELTLEEAGLLSINNDDFAIAVAAAHIYELIPTVSLPTNQNLFTAYALSGSGIQDLNDGLWNINTPGLTAETRKRHGEHYRNAIGNIQ